MVIYKKIDYANYDYSVDDYYNLSDDGTSFDPADYGLTTEELFDTETVDLINEFGAEEVDLSALGRSLGGGSRPKLPAGIKVADFIINGVFDKEGFRNALRQALVAQVLKYISWNLYN